MPTQTTNYGFNKPLVNNATDADLWGGQLNTNFDSLDSIIFNGTGYNGGTAAGTANAITATPTPALTAYSNLDGKVMALKIANTNTSGTVTMQLSGLSTPPSVKKFIGASKVDLAIGDLQAGMMGLFSRDGTDIILLNPRGYSQGADIASASTVNLDTATGDYVVVTGTTTITAITLSQGRQVTVRFSGVLTLTNGASLILPSGANITTAAGDVAVFRGEASGVVRCVSYNRASGTALVVSSAVTKATSTALTPSAGGSGSFTHGLGAKPDIIVAFLKCTSTSGSSGWAVGDEIYMETNAFSTAGFAVYTDNATEIKWKIASGGIVWNNSFLTLSSFELYLRGIRIT